MNAKFLLAHTLKARVSFKFRRSYVSKYKLSTSNVLTRYISLCRQLKYPRGDKFCELS